ncbi:hypothetical protein IWQ57_000811 [Coemansia nantahalensis]|uniref:Uncharacterized protein n=1 Tax=Coemansia nantahalensis TaxID=2789366 RepID=A0ACC1K6A5_9FUNG|nr:hypothetical protein IWQ57_000811 [Coemansia nantahalensis]
MVAVANIASLLAALLVAGSLAAPPNVHAPPPDGVAPRAGAPPVEGGSCDIATDRVACANATSIVMCRHNKWVALSSCGSGRFNQAVSKASAAIGQSYPRPSNAQCSAFLSGLPKGRISSGREAAMFLANILWESDGLRAKEEYDCKANPDWCAQNYKLPDDSPGKAYWGRGYIQLTWGYNYKAASRALFGSDVLVNNPSLVANNENVAWDVSYWYWSENVHSDPGVQAGKFGASVNKINGALECRGAAQAKAKKRYEMYKLSDGERAYLARHGTDMLRDFYRVWTAKEAYVKATGTGIVDVDLATIDVSLAPDGQAGVRANGQPVPLELRAGSLDSSHVFCVAAARGVAWALRTIGPSDL